MSTLGSCFRVLSVRIKGGKLMNGKLSCSATECVHNINSLCSANTIHVGGINAYTSGGTQCDTFAEKSFKNAFANMGNMNVVGEIKQLFTNSSVEMSPQIKCDAIRCTYNEGKICVASNVQIYGPAAGTSEGTQCETFID